MKRDQWALLHRLSARAFLESLSWVDRKGDVLFGFLLEKNTVTGERGEEKSGFLLMSCVRKVELTAPHIRLALLFSSLGYEGLAGGRTGWGIFFSRGCSFSWLII